MKFTIDKFNPTKKELTELANKYQGLEIKSVDDTAGYAMVDTARKDLKEKRVFIKKTAKEMRDDANKFAKDVITLEKDLIGIIEPLEKDLQLKQVMIDNEKELPERIEKLKEIEVTVEDSILLKMNNREFKKFYEDEKLKYLEKKEQELKAKELEEERKQELEEVEKRAKEQAEQEAKEREEKIKREAEEEKQRIIQEQKDKEEEEKRAKEEKAKKEKAIQEKAEKNKKYQEWQKKNNFNDNTDIILKREGNTFTIFRKVSSITIE